jgi:hypothetical protein
MQTNFNTNVINNGEAFIRFDCRKADGSVKEILTKRYREYFEAEVNAIRLLGRGETSNYNGSSYLLDLFWLLPVTPKQRQQIAQMISSHAYIVEHNGIIEMGIQY